MSLLEDRIIRIIELRKLGFDDQKISEELALDRGTIKQYEESTKEAIMNVVSKGYKKIEDIAKRVQLSPVLVNIFIQQYNIDQYQIRIKPEEVIKQPIEKVSLPIGFYRMRKGYFQKRNEIIKEAIEQAINDGAESAVEISQKVGYSLSAIYKYAKINNIEFPKTRKPTQERVEVINKLIQEGADSIKEISERIGLNPATVLSYEKLGYISFPEDWDRKNLYSARERPEISDLVKQGYHLTEIAKSVESTREWVRQYINARGLYKTWKEARKRRKELKKEILRDLIYTIDQRIEQLYKSNKTSWEHKKTFEYMSKLKHKHRQIHVEKIVDLFRRYRLLQEKGEKEPLETLAISSGLSSGPLVGKIFEKVGLEPLYGNRRFSLHTKIDDKKKKTIKQLAKLKMSNQDITYFLNISSPTVGRIVGKTERTKPIKIFSSPRFEMGIKGWLTYRLASEIYEAQDLGYNKRETIKLLDTKDEIVKYALKHRESIQPVIIEALRVLYPNKKINKPYKS